MRKKNWRWLLVGVALLAILGGSTWYFHERPSLVANQEQQRILKKKILLVALGDSLTHGQGDEKDQGGYVGQIKTRLEDKYGNQVTTENFGVTGDRSDQIKARLDSQKEIQTGIRSADVIVMTVGGNDLMQTLEKTAFSDSSSTVEKAVDAAGKTYQLKLTALLKDVRKYNPNAQIFVFSIYNPFYTYFPNVTVISKTVAKWNQLTKQVVAKYQPATFVDVDYLLSYGQYTTREKRQQLAAQAQKTNDGQISQASVLAIMNNKDHNLNEYISTTDNFHPNHLGYTKMTDKLFNAMVHNNSFEYQTR